LEDYLLVYGFLAVLFDYEVWDIASFLYNEGEGFALEINEGSALKLPPLRGLVANAKNAFAARPCILGKALEASSLAPLALCCGRVLRTRL